ncbi:MAG: NTP transferase domain-containing protein [Oscillospiraceae bacterium]|jgi:dTDP-glucose pyrophosphorylase|nr:NTP transferase domain-containing protein [Oscillospiraceae bacterium]
MKAIILAGGEGTRLRPISGNMPKPMIRIGGEPVLAHIIRLLRRNGVTDARLTLGYMPHVITDYFGDEFEGVALTYSTEATPRGTAGGVRDCADFVGGADFLVVSGDCVCDFDLAALTELHRARGSAVTIALHQTQEPPEYGLVVCREDGRIEKFVEKPAWEGVVTDMVSTGIYVLSPAVLAEIPETGACDFGRDLFPKLLAAGTPMYAAAPEGYWRDIGTPESYYGCRDDALRGLVKLELTPPDGAQDAPAYFPSHRIEFTRRGELSGELGAHISAADCLKLGMAAGAFGRVGVGWSGGDGARVAAGILSCGINVCGGDTISHDAGVLSVAAFVSRNYHLPLSAFVTQRGNCVKICFLGPDGSAVSRELERKLLKGEPAPASGTRTGGVTPVVGVRDAYAVHAAGFAASVAPGTLKISVSGGGAASRTLREALTLAGGFELAEKSDGVPSFEVSADGARCTAHREDGREIDFGHMLLIAAMAAFENSAHSLTLQPDAPEALEALAERYGATVARSEHFTEVWSRDGVILAAHLCAYLRSRGVTLAQAEESVPKFGLSAREVTLRGGRGAVMRRLSASMSAEAASMLDTGLVLRSGGGTAIVSPVRGASALRIYAESMSAEAAAELCAELERKIAEVDD